MLLDRVPTLKEQTAPNPGNARKSIAYDSSY